MKIYPSSLILIACMGISPCTLAQSGTAGSPPGGAASSNPPAANPNSNPNPNPNSSPISGQNNNPSANPQAPTSNGDMPITPTNPQMPPAVNTRPPAPGSGGSANTNGTGQLFSTLDQSRKGYLNQADVASNQFLTGHFQQCDSNGDGRLTQDEVGACLQQMPPGE